MKKARKRISESDAKAIACDIRKHLETSAGEFYKACKLVYDAWLVVPYGQFDEIIADTGLTPKTARNMINYAFVVSRAMRIGGDDLRQKVLALSQVVVYDLGSRNILDSSRDAILAKIGRGNYRSQADIKDDITASNRKRVIVTPIAKQPCRGKILPGEPIADGREIIIPCTSDGSPGEVRMMVGEALQFQAKLTRAIANAVNAKNDLAEAAD